MKRTSLKPGGSLKRAGRLPAVSTKMRQTQTALRKAYKVVAAEQECCFTCGSGYELQNSHLLTQKQHPAERANPLNIFRECPGCHLIWENQKFEYARRWPEKYAFKVARMEQIHPDAHRFFLLKNPTPAGSPLTTEGDSRAN